MGDQSSFGSLAGNGLRDSRACGQINSQRWTGAELAGSPRPGLPLLAPPPPRLRPAGPPETEAVGRKPQPPITRQDKLSAPRKHGGTAPGAQARAGWGGCRLEPSPYQGPIPRAKHPPHLLPRGPTARTAEEEGRPPLVQLPDTSCANSRTPNPCPRLPIHRPCVQAWPGPVTLSVRLASPPLASSTVCPAPATPPPPR